MLAIRLLADGDGYAGFELGNNSLSRGPGTKDINNFLPGYDASVQSVNYLGAAALRNIARKDQFGETVTLNPEINYGFATENDKAAFLLALQANVPAVATVQITVGATDFYLIDAKLRPIRTVQEWETAIILQFTISGGIFAQGLSAS